MKSPSMSVSCIAGLITFVYLINVALVRANPVQDQCNTEKPFPCPAYGICCRADQFCSDKSGTCEECFPVNISERKDRLKFCYDEQQMKRTNSRMRGNTCVGACTTVFNMTEIINYTGEAPKKTVEELIADHNISIHKHLEDQGLNRIDENQRWIHKLEEKLEILKESDYTKSVVFGIIASLSLLLAIIAISASIYLFRRSTRRKKKYQTDLSETKNLMTSAFDLDDINSSLSKTKQTLLDELQTNLTNELNLEDHNSKLSRTKTLLSNDLNTKLTNEFNLEDDNSSLSKTKKLISDDLNTKLTNEFNLNDDNSLVSKVLLSFKEELKTAVNESSSQVVKEENYIKNLDLKAEVTTENDNPQPLLDIKNDEIKISPKDVDVHPNALQRTDKRHKTK
ncbi:uncharacterized protein LOC131930118 isoform X2 [Physella acuta]|uniref:uncharacterized protein LOC131930118 isoform X2 n=1 Tax=Physella acuta TaxID=109671 RepID=UPI0027DB7D45|nr:uncharacterized protein LOC131930118 isoform X2 [Physella acuta]